MASVLSRTGTSGNTSVVATGSMPITKIGVTSSTNTTFTATTVVDGTASEFKCGCRRNVC